VKRDYAEAFVWYSVAEQRVAAILVSKPSVEETLPSSDTGH
jgi:hypothetical protein